MELGTVLGVWAHPDDETYLSAGLMAQAVRDGDRVVCITATRGEGGSLDEERWPPETMGACGSIAGKTRPWTPCSLARAPPPAAFKPSSS